MEKPYSTLPKFLNQAYSTLSCFRKEPSSCIESVKKLTLQPVVSGTTPCLIYEQVYEAACSILEAYNDQDYQFADYEARSALDCINTYNKNQAEVEELQNCTKPFDVQNKNKYECLMDHYLNYGRQRQYMLDTLKGLEQLVGTYAQVSAGAANKALSRLHKYRMDISDEMHTKLEREKLMLYVMALNNL